jgi:hypothetical protein
MEVIVRSPDDPGWADGVPCESVVLGSQGALRDPIEWCRALRERGYARAGGDQASR